MMTGHERDAPQRTGLRERIMMITTKVFTLKGIECITMGDVAAALGISERTLYEVFTGEEPLLKGCILQKQAERDKYLQEIYERSNSVLKVILVAFQKGVEVLHQISKCFLEDIKKYPKVYAMMRDRSESDSEKTMSFFKSRAEQGIFRADVNFGVVNLLVHGQFDVLSSMDVYSEYPFTGVYESIMPTYIHGISTKKGAKVSEEFISEYRRNRVEQQQGLGLDDKQLKIKQKRVYEQIGKIDGQENVSDGNGFLYV